jgi:cytochrome c553
MATMGTMAGMPSRKPMAVIFFLTFLASLAGNAAAQNAITPEKMIERAIHVCNACHGEDGNSKLSTFPKLAGQPVFYLAEQLRAFRSQTRADSSPQAYMWGISALLDENTIAGLADYYATKAPIAGKPGKAEQMEKGRRIFNEGIPAHNVMACKQCHGENGEGASVFPRIASQHADYIVKQLNEFSTKLRPHGVIMAERVVKNMTPEDMRAVAVYLQAK